MEHRIPVVYLALGSLYRGLNKNKEAITCFQKAIGKGLNAKQKSIAMASLGSVYTAQGQYNKALDYADKAIKASREAGYRRGEAKFLALAGSIQFCVGNYKKAHARFIKALSITDEGGFKHLKNRKLALDGLGKIYSIWGEYQKAVDHYEKAIKLARKLRGQRAIGDEGHEGTSYRNLAEVYKDWGRYDQAEKWAGEALSYAKSQGGPRDQGRALYWLGNVAAAQGNYEKAAQYYQQSLAMVKKSGDRKGQGATYSKLGIVYRERGRYKEALKSFQQSMDLARRISDRGVQCSALTNLGELYAKWGQYQTASGYYKRAAEIARRLSDAKQQARILDRLGSLYISWGDHKKAFASFGESVKILEKMRIPPQSPLDLIAHLHLDLGQVEKAEAVIGKGGSVRSQGRLALVKDDYQGARVHYDKLLELAEKSRSADDLFSAHTGLGLVHEGLGDHSTAASHFRRAIERTEELRSSLSQSERAAFYNVRVGGFLRTVPYEGLARVLTKLNKPQEALRESEYTKARMFAESLSGREEGTPSAIPDDILTIDSKLNDQLAALLKNRQKGYEKHDNEVIKSIEPQIMHHKERLAEHVKMLREKFPLFAATKYPQPMDLTETAIKNDEWVLAFDVTDSGILVYLTGGRDLKKALFKPFPRKRLDELVRRFREPLEISSADDAIEKLKSFDFDAGQKLFKILLEEAVSEIPKGIPVTIIPDDSLGVLPFEALVLNEKGEVKGNGDKSYPYITGAEFFGDRNAVVYYQSITTLSLSRALAKREKPGTKLLVMADPVFQTNDKRVGNPKRGKSKSKGSKFVVELMAAIRDSRDNGIMFQRLPQTGDLADRLSTIYEGKCDVYTGLAASKKSLFKKLGPNLERYGSIVFATHGYLDKGNQGQLEPLLVLSLLPRGVDGFLRLTEVMGLRMNSSVVALTACQTGLGRVVSGEGTMAMGRAFQYAGAKSVLMSLWSVSERASVNLVESFFKHLKAGKSKAEALRTARKEIREAGFDHPFFWAPFILVGEAE